MGFGLRGLASVLGRGGLACPEGIRPGRCLCSLFARKEFDLVDECSCCLLVERNSTWSVLLLYEIWGRLPVQEAAPAAVRLQEALHANGSEMHRDMRFDCRIACRMQFDCRWSDVDCGRSHHMRPVGWHAVRRLPAGGLLYPPVARTVKFGCLLKALLCQKLE